MQTVAGQATVANIGTAAGTDGGHEVTGTDNAVTELTQPAPAVVAPAAVPASPPQGYPALAAREPRGRAA